MTNNSQAGRVEAYLQKLCLDIPDRRTGSQGNRAATDFAAGILQASGLQTTTPTFDCLDWIQEGVRLTAGKKSFEVHVGPYSLGCQVQAPLVVASTVNDLATGDFAGKILLVRDDLAREQLMPKNFPFYNPDEHKQIIRLFEEKKPAAIVAATTRNPSLAGGLYPFPLIEDGDFDIPNIYMTDVEGAKLAKRAGRTVSLEINARRIPTEACNVIGRVEGHSSRRIVFCAHIDAKEGTPGALDNATGVVTLLLLAEMLQDYAGNHTVELVLFNGEDHYSAAGQIAYLDSNKESLEDVILVVNLDGVGYHHGRSAFSFYWLPDDLADEVRETFAGHEGLVEGAQWYQGDHMIFVQRNTPAVAFTSSKMAALWTEIAHTANDRPELVDPAQLVNLAKALHNLARRLT